MKFIRPFVFMFLSITLVLFQNCSSGFEGSFGGLSSQINSSVLDSNTTPLQNSSDDIPQQNDSTPIPNTGGSSDIEMPTTAQNQFLILQVNTKNLTDSSVTIEWVLTEQGTGQIFYGEKISGQNINLNQSTNKEVSFSFKTHIQSLAGLKENTTYNYEIVSFNERGDKVTKQNLKFTTKKKAVVTIPPEIPLPTEPTPVTPPPSENNFYKYPPSQTNPSTQVKRVLSPPALGQTLEGDISGTTVRGVSPEGVRHQYSRRQAWNSNETVFYMGEKAYRVSDLSMIRNIASMMSSEWYPSHLNPDVIYGIVGSRFLKGYISTGQTELIVDVGENITLGEYEGGISIDDKYALVESGKRRLRVIDITGKKVVSGPYTIAGNINGADISQDGNYLVWTAGGTTYYSDRNFKNVIKTSFTTPHSDLCVDVNGDQVYVMFTGASEIVLLRLKDNFVHRKNILYTGNGHVSCTNYKRPGWTYVAAHRGGELAFTLKLDYFPTPTYEIWGSTHQYLVDYNNAAYDPQPKLSASPSGTQLIFTSEWNKKTKFRDFVIKYKQ